MAGDDSDSFEWESDGEAEPSSAAASSILDSAGPSTLVRQDLSRDSDDSDKFEWESDGEAEPSLDQAPRNLDVGGPLMLVRQESNGWTSGEAPSTSLVEGYVGMGFPKEMVIKGIKEIGHSDANALLELLLTYKTLGDEAAGNCSTSGLNSQSVENDDNLDFQNDDTNGREPNSDGSCDEPFIGVELHCEV